VSPVTKRKVRSMSALPVPPPESKRRASRKDGLRTIARLLEEQMDEMGLSEEEKDLKVDGLVEHVKKVKSAHGGSRPK
jgi:hypothetical protein